MLDFDSQLEIIKRLPVKSLIQFRSVCKAWKSFIDSSQFIAGYSVPHTQPQHLLIKYEDPHITGLKLVCFVDDDTFPQQKFALTLPSLLEEAYTDIIIDSCHGVLCFYGWLNSSVRNIALLWNPSIRKSMAVVVPHVFDARFSSALGFGVCPHTCDPMLVNVTYIDYIREIESISCFPCQVMVFTLSSGEWTCLSSNQQLPRKSIKFTSSQAVIGQFIYWFAFDRIDVLDGEPRNLIMSFDMSSQEFREIDLPDCLAHDVLMSVSRLRESLVLLQYNTNFTTDKQVCDVWMMEHGDSKAFTKLFTINPPNASVSETLGFRKSGEPIVELLDELPDDEDFDTPYSDTPCLVVYEPCSEHVKDLEIWGNSFSVYSYTESLLLLDHDDGHIVRCGDVKSVHAWKQLYPGFSPHALESFLHISLLF